MQGQLQSEGIFGSARTYVQGYRYFCSGQEPTQQPPGHSVPPSLFDTFLVTWYFFLAVLRPSSDSASWQFSTLLATWCNFPCSGVLLTVRHLAPSCSRDTPSWSLGVVTALSGQLLPRCLRSASLLGALLTTPHPPRCSILFDLIVTLLASGSSPSFWLAAAL